VTLHAALGLKQFLSAFGVARYHGQCRGLES
jgi:hypothetical protein